jgi:anti-anti-sigma regulatory factor
LAEKKPLFLPIANALDEMNKNILEKARKMPGYRPEIAKQIAQDSHQIGQVEAELILAIIVDPLVKSTFFNKFTIDNDFINQEKSIVYTFYVPQSYWKIVIVKPFSEAYEVTSTIIQLVITYLAILIIPVILFAYFIFDWFLFQPLTTTSKAVRTMSGEVAKLQQNQLKDYQIPSNADEIGLLSESFNTLITEFSEVLLKEKKLLEQRSQQVEKTLLEKNKQLETAIAECQLEKKQHQEQPAFSTHIFQIGDNILVLPQMGNTQETSQILQKVSETMAEYVILNLTGLIFVDALEAANHLVKMVQALKLMGTECILTGVPPTVAEAILDLNTDFHNMTTFAKLQQGLHYAVSGNDK